MRKFMLLSFIILFSLADFCFSLEAGKFYIEASPGFSLGLGQGYNWTTLGAQDETTTYTTRENQPASPIAISANLKLGLGIFDNVMILVAGDFKVGWREWTSANSWKDTGDIKYEYTYKLTWFSLSVNPGFRIYTDPIGSFKFFAGAGALICFPLDLKIEATDNDPFESDWKSERIYKFDIGVGAYGELGLELMFTDVFGMNLMFIANWLELALNLYEYNRYSGTNHYTATTVFEDSVRVDINGQTASDIQRSTSDHDYYSSPKQTKSFSGIEAKLGFTVRFF